MCSNIINCEVIISRIRWLRPGGEHKYNDLIPSVVKEEIAGDIADDHAETERKPRKIPNKLTNKGALYHEYCLKVHSFLTHLRRVHPKLRPTMIDVSGQGIRIPVKAADPLAPTGRQLYYYHGKTVLYNDLFFILWDSVIHRVFQYVCPWMIVKTQKDLNTLLSLEFIG